MRYLIPLVLALVFTLPAAAQTTDCPSGMVCVPQATANRLYDAVGQLVEAKDVIAKMLKERGTSDQALANAMKVIDGYKELEVVNGQIIAKHEQMEALYKKTLDLAFMLIDRYEKQLGRGKSGWDKLLGGVKRVLDIAAGVAIGSVL